MLAAGRFEHRLKEVQQLQMKAVFTACVLLGTAFLAACGGGGGTAPAAGKSCITAPSTVVTTGTLTIGSDVSYPPQEFMKQNVPTGFDLDVGAALASKMCLKSAVVNQTFDSIIPALNAKKFDVIMSAMTITDARKQTVSFVPYFNAGEALVAKKGSSLHITNLSQLCGRTVAAEEGTAEKDEVTTSVNPKCASGKQVNLKTFQTDTEALEQLRKGTVDVHFTDSPVAEYEVKQEPGALKIVSPVLEVAPEGIAVRKDDTQMLDAVQKAFKAIEGDGTYHNLLVKWGVADGDIRKAS
jgi:polar amino acid transport system substrate-binding protein